MHYAAKAGEDGHEQSYSLRIDGARRTRNECGMNKTFSLYLDAIRLAAALTVAVGHLSASHLTGGLGWQAAAYMGDAVTVFFVLSGFLIAHATRREASARSYAVARLARLASVALPALVLTFALDAAGRTLNPALYANLGGYVWDGRVWQAAASLLFANQWWWLDIAAGSNLPYWSMSFVAAHPILAILAGVAAGLASNFHMSRRVFTVKL